MEETTASMEIEYNRNAGAYPLLPLTQNGEYADVICGHHTH